jgi:hypothetical protein
MDRTEREVLIRELNRLAMLKRTVAKRLEEEAEAITKYAEGMMDIAWRGDEGCKLVCRALDLFNHNSDDEQYDHIVKLMDLLDSINKEMNEIIEKLCNEHDDLYDDGDDE